MSQRNPMNERYTTEGHTGKTRKSASSAKPKMKVAGTVVEQAAKKTKQQRKAEAKAERKKQQARQREIDRKYYTPDTQRYRNLRKLWWAFLIGGIICVAVSFLAREQLPDMVAMVILFAAYAFIIAAFYVDLSKIRKERQAYQARMVAQEEAEAKRAKAAERAERTKAQASAKGKKAKGGAAKPAEADEADKADKADDAPAEDGKPAKKRRGFFGNGFRLPKDGSSAKDAKAPAENGPEEDSKKDAADAASK